MDFFSSSVDVSELILKKSYGKAVKVLKARLEADPGKFTTYQRQQLADVLILDGKTSEALPILEALADEFARGGLVAKAIAVLKKTQRLDPSRVWIDAKLARLLKEKDAEADRVQKFTKAPPSIEEIAARRSATAAASEMEPSARFAEPMTPVGEYLIEMDESPAEKAAAASRPPVASPPAAAPPAVPSVEVVEPWREFGMEPPDAGVPAGLTKTPLFSDFDANELLAVMEGLALRSVEAGDVIVSEGEPGASMFILSTGIAKAWVRDATGRAHPIRTMCDGDFFGEVSIMTGRPRTATITAATACELLELDRDTVTTITRSYPRVQEVLAAFCDARMHNPAEQEIRRQGA